MLPGQYNTSMPPTDEIADRGAYFTVVNPTPGAGLSTIAALTSLVDTSPFIAFATGANRLYLDYIKLIVAAAGTGGTALRYAWKTDVAKAAPTGGTTLTPASSLRSSNTSQPVAKTSVYAGPLTAAAAATPVLHAHGLVRPVIPVVADTYFFKFGASDYGVSSLVPSGTANADRYVTMPPAELDANMTGQFHIWLPGQSALSSYEIEIGFFEFA